MARCPRCTRSFRTLEDEQDMHDCPHCGYGPDWSEPMMCSNIRYVSHDQVAFEWKGQTIYIREPQDVLLVGTDPRLASQWIVKRYGYLLDHIGDASCA